MVSTFAQGREAERRAIAQEFERYLCTRVLTVPA
jgi:hypothetical protein